MPKKEYSQCIVPACQRPLGQETKDLDYRVCHEHRTCSVCGKELLPIDVQIAHDRSLESLTKTTFGVEVIEDLELAHSRCLIASGKLGTLEADPTISIKQSTYNLLNAARLMVDPDMNLSMQTNENNAMIRSREFCLGLTAAEGLETLDFDKIYVHLKMMESCVATASLFIATQDRKAIKNRADLREAEKFKKATAAAKTSTRPAAKKNEPEDNAEIELAKFMELFSIKERKTALELKRNRDKAILALTKLGFPSDAAITKCNEDMLKNRKGW